MKKTNNKGFSLVELIIVIAIMAILIGVLAPQYIKYVEKSRRSADIDLLDSVYTACSVAASDPEVTDAPQTSADDISFTGEWGEAVIATLGLGDATDLSTVEQKLKSKDAKDGADTATIEVTVDDNGNFTVTAGQLTVPDTSTDSEE